MLRSNLEAKLERKEKELYTLEQDNIKMGNLIKSLEAQIRITEIQIKDLKDDIKDIEEELQYDT